jgi:hypothetical protein
MQIWLTDDETGESIDVSEIGAFPSQPAGPPLAMTHRTDLRQNVSAAVQTRDRPARR